MNGSVCISHVSMTRSIATIHMLVKNGRHETTMMHGGTRLLAYVARTTGGEHGNTQSIHTKGGSTEGTRPDDSSPWGPNTHTLSDIYTTEHSGKSHRTTPSGVTFIFVIQFRTCLYCLSAYLKLFICSEENVNFSTIFIEFSFTSSLDLTFDSSYILPREQC